MRFPDTWKRQNDPLQEFLKCRHVGYPCFDQVVEPPNHHMAFDDLGCLCNSLCEAVEDVRGGMIEPDLDKDERAASDLRGLEHSPDGSDKAFSEKALDAL